jgi:hypothetical protein
MSTVVEATVVQGDFDRDGYVAVEGVFDPVRDFEPVLADWNVVLDEIAADLVAAGRLRSTYDDLPFRERLIQLCAETGETFTQHFDISLPQSGATADTPLNLPDSVFRLLTHERLLDIIEQIIGPEISANPVQHVRMKLPRHALAKHRVSPNYLADKVSWHQDNGVMLPEADSARIISVWFPLGDATVDNGCLRVIPGSHRGDLIAHCPGEQALSIPDKLLPVHQAVPVPMEAGSAMIFEQLLVHESLENVSDGIRISVDLRYQAVGEPTGRPLYPAVTLRSAENPSSVVDAATWRRSWDTTKARLVGTPRPKYNRWDGNHPMCA